MLEWQDINVGLKGKEGYLPWDRVRAILPSGYVVPERRFDGSASRS
jgi:hypothetical protein